MVIRHIMNKCQARRRLRPAVGVDRPLVVTFAESVDPAHTVFVLMSWPEDVATWEAHWASSAIGRLDGPADRVVFPASALDGQATVYRAETDGHALLARIETADCRDIMSGERFPVTVSGGAGWP